MTLELAALPLALVAGIFGVLSLGLALSFAAAGTILTLLLVSTGLDPELFRWFAAGLLVAVGAVLLVRRLNDWVTLRLSMLTNRFNVGGTAGSRSAPGQFGVGALLGIVWLPCVGPTLGAAIALASMGQSMGMAFLVMLAYGVGTAGVLLLAGIVSSKVLACWRPAVMSAGGTGKKILGWSLLILGGWS